MYFSAYGLKGDTKKDQRGALRPFDLFLYL